MVVLKIIFAVFVCFELLAIENQMLRTNEKLNYIFQIISERKER